MNLQLLVFDTVVTSLASLSVEVKKKDGQKGENWWRSSKMEMGGEKKEKMEL